MCVGVLYMYVPLYLMHPWFISPVDTSEGTVTDDKYATTTLQPGSHDGHVMSSGQPRTNSAIEDESLILHRLVVGRSYSDSMVGLESPFSRRLRPMEVLVERRASESAIIDRHYNGEDADEEGEGESEAEGEATGDVRGKDYGGSYMYSPERSVPIAIQVRT